MNVNRSILSVPLALVLCAWCRAASGQITTGAVVELLATDNPSGPDAWANLGSAGSQFDADTGNPPPPPIDPPALGSDPDLTAYYDLNDASWGNGPNTTPSFSMESFTVEAWVRRNETPVGIENHLFGLRVGLENQRTTLVLQKNDGVGSADRIWVQWELFDAGTGKRLFFGPGRTPPHHDVQLPLPLDEWFHLVLVYDDAASSASIYSNGMNVVSTGSLGQNFSAGPWVNNSLGLANHLESMSRSFHGHINTFRVYDVALSAGQVAAHFAEGPVKGVPTVPAVPITHAALTDIPAITFTSQVGRTYFLQSTTNAPDWEESGSRIDGTGGILRLHDPAGFSTQKTYRVVEF